MKHVLDSVNLTELIEMCREAGLGNLSRFSTRQELYDALEFDEISAECPLEEKRVLMEGHIQARFRRLRTQLPCPKGRCITFGCPDLVVQRCWAGMKDDML